jgi:hypothetical protein
MGTNSNPFLESVNSGEFSPRMEARVTFERYGNAAKMCRNMHLLPQGGMTRRPGTRFVAEVFDSSDDTIIFPFQFSESDAWIIEAGDAYFRFFRRQAAVDVPDTSVAVTNGSFSGSAASWTLGGTAVYGSGKVAFPASGDTAAQTGIAVAAGDRSKQHVVSFDITGIGVMDCTVTDNAATVLVTRDVTAGYHSIGFITGAGSTSIDITFTSQGSSSTTGATLYLDNVNIADNQPLYLNTPYPVADLADLRFFQAADVVYILHQSHPTRRLERHGTYNWSLEDVTFLDGPYLPQNTFYTDIEFFDPEAFQLLQNPFFEDGLQGWTDASTGDGHIFHTSVGAEMDDGTSSGSGVASLRTSFSGSLDGSDFIIWTFAVNQGCSLDIGTSAGGATILSASAMQPGWNRTQISSTDATIHLEYYMSGHTGERTGIGVVLVYGSRARLMDAAATTGNTTVAAIGFSPFAATDVGRLLRYGAVGTESGWGIITEYTSATQVSVQIMSPFPTATCTPDWALGAFGGEQGHPKVMGFFDGRLTLACTTLAPQSLWLSQSGDLENMQPDTFSEGVLTVEDTDAIAVTLNSKRIDPVVWLAEVNDLVIGTSGAQWNVDSIGGVVTPVDIFAKTNSALPAGDMEVLAVNQALIFTDRTKREVYEMAYSTEESGYIPTLLTVFADHMFPKAAPATMLAFQRRPSAIVWAPRSDGRIATMAYNRQHNVLGWAQQIIGGTFGEGEAVVEHIAIIPGAEDSGQVNNSDERDEVWLVVKRTINGSTVRYIEVMEGEFEGPLREDYATNQLWWTAMVTAQKDAFYVDSGITYDSTATASITGLSHLEGETVKVLADGKVHPDCTVSSGAITLNYTASKVQVGLPYTSKYLSLKLPTGAEQGTAVNKQKAITGCGVVVLDSGAFKISSVDNDDKTGREMHDLYTFEFRMNPNTDLSAAIPTFTGESYKSLDTTWSTDPRLYIETDAPLPLTLLGLAPNIEGTDESET